MANGVVMVAAIMSQGKERNESKDKEERHAGNRPGEKRHGGDIGEQRRRQANTAASASDPTQFTPDNWCVGAPFQTPVFSASERYLKILTL